MRAHARLVVPCWLMLTGSIPMGCAALPLLQQAAKPDTITVSPPGEDGTRYVAVEGGRLSAPSTLRRRWKSTAERACQGEFMKLSDSASARRQGGVVRSRLHEGFVRCLLEESEPDSSPESPSATDAEAKPAPAPPRRRRWARRPARRSTPGQLAQ